MKPAARGHAEASNRPRPDAGSVRRRGPTGREQRARPAGPPGAPGGAATAERRAAEHPPRARGGARPLLRPVRHGPAALPDPEPGGHGDRGQRHLPGVPRPAPRAPGSAGASPPWSCPPGGRSCGRRLGGQRAGPGRRCCTCACRRRPATSRSSCTCARPPTSSLYTAIVDLSERERMEAERRALVVEAEVARAASTAKDQFLAGLSHELRTPLTPVVAAISGLEPRLARGGLQHERAAGLSDHGPPQPRLRGAPDRRSARRLPPDLRQAGAERRQHRSARRPARGGRPGGREAERKGLRLAVELEAGDAPPREGGRPADAAGLLEPAAQRHQVHARRRGR